MAPSVATKPVEAGTDRVRARLLTALHLGKLRPGDRVLSVRRLAHVTGVNPKIVHRAYRALVDEGYLEVRPGSGTFVCCATGRLANRPSEAELLSALNRCRAEGSKLGLNAAQLAGFIEHGVGGGFDALRLAIVECNHEQTGLIEVELAAGLALRGVPLLLRELRADPRRSLHGVTGVVTTDCHRTDVSEVVDPLGLPVYRVALDPAFPESVIEHAEQGPVVMVVRDDSFGPVFLRLLRQMSGVASVVARVRVVNVFQAHAACDEAGPSASIYVSPLVEPVLPQGVLAGRRRISARWHVERESLNRLRACLAFDLMWRGDR